MFRRFRCFVLFKYAKQCGGTFKSFSLRRRNAPGADRGVQFGRSNKAVFQIVDLLPQIERRVLWTFDIQYCLAVCRSKELAQEFFLRDIVQDGKIHIEAAMMSKRLEQNHAKSVKCRSEDARSDFAPECRLDSRLQLGSGFSAECQDENLFWSNGFFSNQVAHPPDQGLGFTCFWPPGE